MRVTDLAIVDTKRITCLHGFPRIPNGVHLYTTSIDITERDYREGTVPEEFEFTFLSISEASIFHPYGGEIVPVRPAQASPKAHNFDRTGCIHFPVPIGYLYGNRLKASKRLHCVSNHTLNKDKVKDHASVFILFTRVRECLSMRANTSAGYRRDLVSQLNLMTTYILFVLQGSSGKATMMIKLKKRMGAEIGESTAALPHQ
ncbi:hypothetical protein AZE42_04301 [Rhizopogon vesiculosus]|uniref:Uncharacterized protein n=1 Tax=Rhizopogon vesiculosus TaxID=180088 RepID=A0A1J8R378_9AGAM|nr:hypothetical protein AZE42_04301 [Rhizopogon vesiculosus]